MKGVDLRPSFALNQSASRFRNQLRYEIETRYPVSFTEYGVVENEELFLVNVRPQKDIVSPSYRGRSSRPRNQWDTVIGGSNDASTF
ncbi:hypothetical protein DPMN_008293 [Dreissena polymorpha]|uniref:Uncharacterized protein n=1 Tax=Dreissena polymorpha TaxID=45954 RepID=A0A9D4MYY3_DREPO|nr:hypothetical protein DPMN_008293 [Dreissena polymorpha]